MGFFAGFPGKTSCAEYARQNGQDWDATVRIIHSETEMMKFLNMAAPVFPMPPCKPPRIDYVKCSGCSAQKRRGQKCEYCGGME